MRTGEEGKDQSSTGQGRDTQAEERGQEEIDGSTSRCNTSLVARLLSLDAGVTFATSSPVHTYIEVLPCTSDQQHRLHRKVSPIPTSRLIRFRRPPKYPLAQSHRPVHPPFNPFDTPATLRLVRWAV